MQKKSSREKLINYLILAAVLLPLIFVAEVVFVEKQYVKDNNQVHNEKLRAEAEVYWLSGQTAYIRGIAKLNAVIMNDPEAPAPDLRSFLTGDFVTLGYAQPDGKVQADTSGSGIRDISSQSYFVEAAAGREFTGRVAGNDWLQNEEVTVLAVPAIVNGAVTGVVYGVIRQETIEEMFVNLVPAGTNEKQVVGRWLAWLGGMYFLEIIPLLFLVYLLRRPREFGEAPTTALIQKSAVAGRKLVIPETQAHNVENSYQKNHFAEGLTAADTPENIAVRKIAEMIALNEADAATDTTLNTMQLLNLNPVPNPDKVMAAADIAEPAKIIRARRNDETISETADVSPAAVIDRVLAVAAYKGSRTAAQKQPVGSSGFEPRSEPLLKSEPKPEQQPVSPVVKDELPVADKLTKLYTQSVFEKNVAAQMGKHDMGFIVLSIDGMKVINDFLGNLAGDGIIIAIADILKLVTGPAGMAARVEGDKFVALFNGVSSETLEDIKKDIKYNIDLHNLRHSELPLSITTGAAMARPGESLSAAWDRAIRDMESHKAINRVEARKFIMMSIKRFRQNREQ